MGSLTWHGWQTSLVDAHGTTGIIYGGNLRKRLGEEKDKKSEQAKHDERKETHVSGFTNPPVPPHRKPQTDKEG